MRALALLLILFVPSLAGCASGGTPDFDVRIDSEFMKDGKKVNTYGHGILIDEHHVVTVNHVAPGKRIRYMVSRASVHVTGHKRRIRYIRARYLGSFGHGQSIEPLSVLRLDSAMSCDAFPEFRGIEPGDSGSPILGKRGEVVGLITGYTQNMFYPGRTILGTNGKIGPIPRTFKRRPERKKSK